MLKNSSAPCASEGWWTRTQRIRTAAERPFEVALLDTSPPPTYQRIAGKALHLRELGLTDATIARRLGVTDKTVAKGICWLRATALQAEGSEAGS